MDRLHSSPYCPTYATTHHLPPECKWPYPSPAPTHTPRPVPLAHSRTESVPRLDSRALSSGADRRGERGRRTLRGSRWIIYLAPRLFLRRLPDFSEVFAGRIAEMSEINLRILSESVPFICSSVFNLHWIWVAGFVVHWFGDSNVGHGLRAPVFRIPKKSCRRRVGCFRGLPFAFQGPAADSAGRLLFGCDASS